MVRVVPEVQIDFANVQNKVQKYFTYVSGTTMTYESYQAKSVSM